MCERTQMLRNACMGTGGSGNIRVNAKHNLDILIPFVEKGSKVLVINPTCSMMMRREYKELLDGEDRERAKKLSEAVNDPSEYLGTFETKTGLILM
ncbi:MAG: hypothetical protein CM1200mP30_27840 [Pseudomonadota bacterium]|nr:MAG: hypothetical protein CM1200mP30_27840 [Pseudomonadota bacterium]